MPDVTRVRPSAVAGVLAAVERPLVLPDHDRVPPPVRIGQRRHQRSGLRAPRPRQGAARPGIEELRHDRPVPGHQHPGLLPLPRPRRHRVLPVLPSTPARKTRTADPRQPLCPPGAARCAPPTPPARLRLAPSGTDIPDAGPCHHHPLPQNCDGGSPLPRAERPHPFTAEGGPAPNFTRKRRAPCCLRARERALDAFVRLRHGHTALSGPGAQHACQRVLDSRHSVNDYENGLQQG